MIADFVIAAIAGNSAGEMGKVEKLLQKSHRTCLESLQLASYSIVARLGFFGILFLASVSLDLVVLYLL